MRARRGGAVRAFTPFRPTLRLLLSSKNFSAKADSPPPNSRRPPRLYLYLSFIQTMAAPRTSVTALVAMMATSPLMNP